MAFYLYNLHGDMELRVFTVVAFCATCELLLKSTPRYRLVCSCFPDSGGGLPVGIWPVAIQVPRSRRMPLFIHSFMCEAGQTPVSIAPAPLVRQSIPSIAVKLSLM